MKCGSQPHFKRTGGCSKTLKAEWGGGLVGYYISSQMCLSWHRLRVMSSSPSSSSSSLLLLHISGQVHQDSTQLVHISRSKLRRFNYCASVTVDGEHQNAVGLVSRCCRAKNSETKPLKQITLWITNASECETNRLCSEMHIRYSKEVLLIRRA